jgi:predicted DNA-binding transcriptional regulator AlpA
LELTYGGIMQTNLKEKQQYEKIIDAKVASLILGISRSSVYKLVDKKMIDYIEYPDAIRFYESDVLNYLQKHRIKAL